MKRAVITLFLMFCAAFAAAQTLESLREQIRRAEEEIRVSQQLLDKNRKDQRVTVQQLKLIRNRILNRKKIISSLEEQLKLINGDISGKTDKISALEKQIDALKGEYSAMIREGYKNYKTNNFTLFIIAADDFNDAARRVGYIRRYGAACQTKAAEIDSLSQTLSKEIEQLNLRREQLTATRKQHGSELQLLGKDEESYKGSVAALRKSESQLSGKVKARQAQIDKAQKRIQQIIAEEARKQATTKKSAAQTEADIKLTGKFDQNMGKLPYPVTGGVVIDPYGIHQHPTQRDLKVNNKGINIAAPRGADVRCVFEGVVTNIFFFQGLNNNVMVRHGSYITVYSNLAGVVVKKGDKVALNQKLGTISDGDDPSDHMLHFEIWKETANLNPSLWLRR